MANHREPLAVCFGGGGAFGIGFDMGVADGMIEDGVDVRSVPLLGTSAGSYAAAALAAGISFDQLADEWAAFTASLPRSYWVRTADLTDVLFGTATAPSVSTVALRLLTLRRTVLTAAADRLSDVVAASSSPVPWARPHRIGRRRYVDGGLRRMASADLTPPADVQLLVTPFAFAAQGLAGRAGARQAPKEIVRWKRATGGEVIHVRPSPEMRVLPVKRMADMNDMDLGRKVYELALPIGRDTARSLRRDYPDVVERMRQVP
jgi:NTE family protein